MTSAETATMDKLSEILKALEGNPEVVVGETRESRTPSRHRESGPYRLSVQIPIWPRSPIPDIGELQDFMECEVEDVIPLEPYNMVVCYGYQSMGKKHAKMGALYFLDQVEEPDTKEPLERWIIISIHPCQEMAKTGGIRDVIQAWTFECKAPCKVQKECVYRQKKLKLPG